MESCQGTGSRYSPRFSTVAALVGIQPGQASGSSWWYHAPEPTAACPARCGAGVDPPPRECSRPGGVA